MLGNVKKLLKTKSLLASPSNVLPYSWHQVNIPANNLNFHWRWRDRIQAIFLNLFYFNTVCNHIIISSTILPLNQNNFQNDSDELDIDLGLQTQILALIFLSKRKYIIELTLKFMFSKKATKNNEIFNVDLTLTK